MIKYTQNKVSVKNSKGETLVHGNCFQTTIACILEVNPSDIPNVETLFDMPDSGLWWRVMFEWLQSKGYEIFTDDRFRVFHDGNFAVTDGQRHKFLKETENEYYLVSGKSPRGLQHVCIYQNGKMVHDVHPSREGILTEEVFEYISKLK